MTIMNNSHPDSHTTIRKILLVDDNPDKRDALNAHLRSEGYLVFCADGCDTALTCLAEQPSVSIMLSDLSLPNMEDGVRLISKAREGHPNLTIIVYTGREVAHGMAAVRAGASFFVEFRSTEELLGIVNALATKREIEEQLQLHKLRGAELQRIFDAVGVELLVRDIHGEITMVNKCKADAWVARGQAAENLSFVGGRNSPDGDWKGPADSTIEQERRIGEHTLLIKNKPIFSDRGDAIGWVEATWDITRRTRLVEFIQELEQAASELSKQQLADRIVAFLAEFTGGRIRFYLRIGQEYRGYASARMPPGFDVKQFKLDEQDEERESAFRDHSVKTGRVDASAKYHPLLTLTGATQKLFIPLYRQLPDKRLGFIVIDNKLDPSQTFTQEDIDLISLFRSFIEVVMKGAVLREEENQEREWLSALSSIEEELALTDDVQSVFTKVLEIMQEKTNARYAVLKSVEADGALVSLEHRGDPVPINEAPFYPPLGSIAHQCIRSAETTMVSDGLNEDAWMRAYLVHSGPVIRKYHQNTKSLVMLPLKSGGKVTAICVLHFAEERALSAIDQEYGQRLLGFVAQAMARMKQNQMIRIEAIKMVEAADAGRAAASLAHSMGNDIQGGLLMVNSMQDMVAPDSPLAAKVRNMGRWLNRMSDRLGSVRDWIVGSKKIDGRELLQRDVLDPIVRITEAQLAEQSVLLRTNYACHDWVLPKGGIKLRLALLDFVQNALRVMPKGGTLEIGFERVDDHLRIYVADTGPGMPNDVRLALESSDLDATDAPIGLGLYLAKMLIGGIGGRLRSQVSRLDGKGAEIQIELQRETAHQ
jgi:signal transduction histidine kinase/CheY-like chemotaxis protein